MNTIIITIINIIIGSLLILCLCMSCFPDWFRNLCQTSEQKKRFHDIENLYNAQQAQYRDDVRNGIIIPLVIKEEKKKDIPLFVITKSDGITTSSNLSPYPVSFTFLDGMKVTSYQIQ